METPLMDQLRRMAEAERDPYRSLMLLGVVELSAKLDEQREWVRGLQIDAEKVHERMNARTDKLYHDVYGNGEEGLADRIKNGERNWKTLMWIVTPLFGAMSVGLLGFLWGMLSGKIAVVYTP